MGAWITRLAAQRKAVERSDLLARSGTVMSFVFVAASWLYLFPIMDGPLWHRALAWAIVTTLVLCFVVMLLSDVWPLRLMIVAGLIILSELLAGVAYRQDSDSLLLAHSLLIGASSTVALSLRGTWKSGVFTGLLGIMVFGHTLATSMMHHLGPTTFLILLGFWLIMLAIRHSAPRALDVYLRDQAVKAESLAAQAVARDRINAASQDARQIHDTVLRGLTLLARGGAGVAPEDFRGMIAPAAYDDGGAPARNVGALGTASVGDAGQVTIRPAGRLAVVEPSTGTEVTSLLKARAREHSRDGFCVDVFGEGGSLPPDVGLAVADAAGECMVNAARHAGSDHVDVLVSRTGPLVSVLVSDAGCGFDAGSLPPESFGVRHSVIERMTEVGGRVRLLSTPGRGTTVVLEVEAA
ncbi:sensor histidine kinase [Paenarthrobacter nicotinovorans]|uniref:sensor histidine kinase n=1 Tax=Paenarthrobacter nicotinovorans TaxID=29320 RepID=UPI001642CA81|nr:ATP-binding protein [Paenarthrobacter nicotinovorans]